MTVVVALTDAHFL